MRFHFVADGPRPGPDLGNAIILVDVQEGDVQDFVAPIVNTAAPTTIGATPQAILLPRAVRDLLVPRISVLTRKHLFCPAQSRELTIADRCHYDLDEASNRPTLVLKLTLLLSRSAEKKQIKAQNFNILMHIN